VTSAPNFGTIGLYSLCRFHIVIFPIPRTRLGLLAQAAPTLHRYEAGRLGGRAEAPGETLNRHISGSNQGLDTIQRATEGADHELDTWTIHSHILRGTWSQ